LTFNKALLERADGIIKGMKPAMFERMVPMFKALEQLKTDHKKGF